MQSHLHQLQQQLSSILSAALPQSPNDAVSSQSSLEVTASGRGIDESARIAALESLRRAVLYPSNSLLLPHCAHFLTQGLSQLLSDKSYGVIQAAAMSYASLCAVLASATLASNGLPNHVHVHVHVLVDRFLAWALPLLRGLPIRNGSAELALTSLLEFLSAGDAVTIERYVPSILKACQELLEDERTSLSLLHQLLSILTLISLKFAHCFQPHFVDVVDLLLGWAFMPDLSDSTRCLLTDSFLQFRNHWPSNLQFSLGLLSKLLGDAEVLIQDVSVETASQLGRLLSLFSCFSTILQATANGILEMNLLGQISEPLENLTPQLLRCISMFGRKFGWSKWMGESWRCLVILAEILNEKFSQFYPTVVDIFFHSLSGVPSYQVLGFLKTNLQLLSLQKLGLLSSAVELLLQFHSPLSHLRLHPNHSVVASTAATYLYFLQHGCDDIVSQAITSLFEELELLKRKLAELHQPTVDSVVIQLDTGTVGIQKTNFGHGRQYSELDLLSLIKFDLKVIICSMSVDTARGFANQTVTDATRNKRSSGITYFILNKFDPFQFPIEGLCELQAHVIRTLYKSSEVEFQSKFIDSAKYLKKASINLSDQDQPSFEASNKQYILTSEYLGKFSGIMVRALDVYSPLTVKIEALCWIRSFSQMILTTKEDDLLISSFNEQYQNATIGTDLLFCILDAAFTRELKVRSHVAPVLELLLHAGLIHPGNFSNVSEVALYKLSDPDETIKNAFLRLISIAVPVFIYMHGITDGGYLCKLKPTTKPYRYYLNWRQALALKQMPQKLHSQQLVSVLSYISQRWKLPLSSWIQRLVFSCRGRNDRISHQEELIGELVSSDLYKDTKAEEVILQKICPVNSLAAIWWSIHEAARYCINLRLRTNLGGPTQTFAALERMLLDIPNILQLDFEQIEGQYLGSSNFHLLPMRLLLAFVEALKKNAYNAYEGSAVLPRATRQSSLFFRANKKVCEEWFSRICEPMLNACLALNCHDATFYYCTSRLQDLKNLAASTFKDKTQGIPENLQILRGTFAGDVLKVLQHASLALCKSREPEALIGLQKWVGMTFPSLFMDENHVSSSVNGNDMNLSWMTGLVYQAQGQYEKAAAHFSHLLQSEEALSSMGSDGIQFIIARIIESYTSLSDWKSLENWLSELQALRSLHAGKPYSGALTSAGNEMNAIHALARFDEGDVQAALGCLDLTPKSSSQLTLNPNVALERSEQMLLRSMLQMEGGTFKALEDLDKAKMMLDEALSCIPLDGLTEGAAFAIQLHCVLVLEESKKPNGQQLPSMLGSLCRSLHSPISRIHQDSSLWMKVFRIYQAIMPASHVTILLGQRILSLARKQGNFKLADRMTKYLEEHPLSELLAVNIQYEGILLKHAAGKPEEALLDLWSFVRADFLSSTSFGFTNISNTKAKACLKLSSWMSLENSNINLRSVISKIHEDLTLSRADGASICNKEVFLSADGNQNSETKWNTVFEEIIGTTIKLSCKLCPKMGKAWLSYAAWCFTQARNSLSAHVPAWQSCSLSSILDEEISPVRFQLTEDEKSKVKSIITDIYHRRSHAAVVTDQESRYFDSTSYPEYQAFLDSLVHGTTYLMEAAAGAPGFESIDGECPSVVLFSELQALFLGAFPGIEKSDTTFYIQELIDIWWSLRRRRVSLFGYAAHGYFQFLSHSSFGLKESHYTNIHPDYAIEKARSCTLRAMLYILVILLNYGVELEETLSHGFATVPPLSWQEITPQLFARLSSHPQQTVRKQIEGILIILAKLSPWSLVFPLLVDINGYEGQSSEELHNIHNYLHNLYPKLIQDVKLVINELGSITILWEEQWLSTLQDLHTDVVRRINMLKEEAARIAKNSSLSHAEKNKINAAKYSAMMAPIVVALDRRLASTSREAETDHERWFQEEYGKQLKSAILSFKTPPLSGSALGDVWRAFDAIAAALAIHQRKSLFSLSEMAPKLALLSSSDVPMPGLEREISLLDACGNTAGVQGIVTVSSFNEQVEILSTKTRPKKLVLLGSDGQKYTYLLKGREDLRLDARFMQLFQAINGFFTSSAESLGKCLGVRCYSVTPINGQAGLIQWVDNVTSIYSVYKSWQNHKQLAQFSATGAINLSNPVPPVPRPSDMFYGKIIPALKEKGIRRVISRRDWPHDVKRKVLLDLMQETPRLLLWQEMWCGSEGFKDFHSKTRRFSGTLAVMSIVGHVIGLGDRHLDNILMDFITGEVVHIDYNVCFDKGRRLKIPEIVPFRLTQTIEAALGLTGTEGIFRANCETVISVLRKNKDIVLMLLDVFVWDPLVEWTREDHDEAVIGGEEKKGMELAVSLSLFASRFQEIRVPLQEHHDLLVSTLPAAESTLKRFLDLLIQYEIVSAVFYHADKERSSLLQHETTAKSFAAETTTILEKSRTYFEAQAHEFAHAKSLATEKALEAASWVEDHGRVLDALRSGSFPNPEACINLRSLEDSLSLTTAVLVSGVPLTVVPEPTQAQCYDLDREISTIIAELDNGLSCGIEALQEYAFALQNVLPFSYVTTSPVNSWAQVLQFSVNNLSAEVLSLAVRQAADIMAKAQGIGLDSIQKRHQDLFGSLERYAMEIDTLNKECSELMNSIGSDTEAKSKERLLSAFLKHLQSAWYSIREVDFPLNFLGKQKLDGPRDLGVLRDIDVNKEKALCVLHIVINELYTDVKENLISMSKVSSIKTSWKTDGSRENDFDIVSHELEEQIEKCVLLAGFVDEVKELIGVDLASFCANNAKLVSEHNWASNFQSILHSIKHLTENITGTVLPEIIQSVVSSNAEVMEAFGSLSHVRGSIDTALEKLVEVVLDRASLLELEKNYFMKVGLITEQQLSLEEAAADGRDHLSWEETEELATQGEACRAQLDQLHQAWNEKDVRVTSLARMETNISNSLTSLEAYFSSLISTEEDGELHTKGSKSFLSALVKPFAELESFDQMLSSYASFEYYSSGSLGTLSNLLSSSPLFDSVWRFSYILKNHSFFIWKIGVVDSMLDSCMHEISSSVDQNIRFDQLCNVLKNKLEMHLQEHLGQYLKERVAPAFLALLERENENLDQKTEEIKSFISENAKDYSEAVRRVRLMLEEYCNAHETARAANSAVFSMKRHVDQLTEALHKTTLEIIQLEWLHEQTLPKLLKKKVFFQNTFNDNKLLKTSRGKLLEKMQSSISSVARSLERLQDLERTSISAEGQLERAMVWACAGSNTVGTGSSSTKCSGIPSEFHDHLLRRRKLLWTAHEHASDVLKICTYVIELEASRDGLLLTHGDKFSGQTTGDSRTWQQTYLTALTRLDSAYHSFAHAEKEWKLSQIKMEAAAKGLLSATNELCITSVKAKSASADLQDNLLALRNCLFDASLALSSFISVSEGHTALTSEGGSMLEEVLVVTEDLHDIYSLAKKASAAHSALMTDLAKANMILLPLGASLSSDMAAMKDAIPKEKESSIDVLSIHGQALYQSYCIRLQEACQSLASLVPSITYSVEELYSMLNKLARDASTHAGNLHKALEGLGESQVVRSQELFMSRPDYSDGTYPNDKLIFGNDDDILLDDNTPPLEFPSDDQGWISPPDCSYTSSIASNDVDDNFYRLEKTSYATNSGESNNSRKESEFDEKQVSGRINIEVNDSSSAALVHCNQRIRSVVGSACHASNVGEGTSDGTKPRYSNDEQYLLSPFKGHEENQEDRICSNPLGWNKRGKNAYAMSVLRQVELKIEGRDIDDGRVMLASQQVDHLIREATSIDNLCNMYEGWTPWI
ncbi:hypothetical protein KFK09_014468 [Dendrobium nobile]|uniref:non-specific serine/threonine protein kinase n=1 Tax=Dendrobium nobile TaxID=94219 RepID=A0A8T3B257_DENNO|nr:hypothetical protein KFK09_014468 [Dendrobium nobile]